MLSLREASGVGMDLSPDPSAWEGLRVTFGLFLGAPMLPQTGLLDAGAASSCVK